MAVKRFQITGYSVHLGQNVYGQNGSRGVCAHGCIEVFDEQNRLVIYFVTSDMSKLEANFWVERRLGTSYAPASMMDAYLQLLHSKTALTAYLDSEHPEQNGIFSSGTLVPVGKSDDTALEIKPER